VAARRLTGRRERRETGRFLAEGAPAVREALAAGAVVELFATADAQQRYPELTADAAQISPRDAAALSETVTPQGLIAVCRRESTSLDDVLAAGPRLLVVLVEPNDPGNVGTVIRTADAVGADGVVLAGGADPYNGKAVRASAGSLFHLPVVDAGGPESSGAPVAGASLLDRLASAGLRTLATTATGRQDLDELIDTGSLAEPTAWLFGSESHGLPPDVLATAADTVAIGMRGRAESFNLAVAAAICLYATARAQRAASTG
jgi:TrmH family RNA methyltransferase